MRIVITGTPGTGKTTLAKALARKTGAKYADVRKIINNRKIYKIKKGETEKTVDLGKLKRELEKALMEIESPASGKTRGKQKSRKNKGGKTNAKAKAGHREKRPDVILESHLLCEIPLKADIAVVLRCNPDVLERRLKKRGYPNAKIRENLLAEALDYCSLKAEANYAKVIDANTTKKTTAAQLEAKIKAKKGDRVNWSWWLLENA